jgi:hypothetical protein
MAEVLLFGDKQFDNFWNGQAYFDITIVGL